MSEGDDRYRLPEPDLGVFGESEPEPERGGHGTMRFQDPESTRPRPPTLAEQRARQQAEREQAEQAALAEQARDRAARRKRLLIGGGVTVGVVALIAGSYLASRPDDVTAQCTVASGQNANTVVADQNCDPDYARTHGGYVSNGFVFVPLLTGGYGQYRYYYGGSTARIGQHVSGGSFTRPDNATIHTNSGRTIQRGGFGVSGKLGGSGGS